MTTQNLFIIIIAMLIVCPKFGLQEQKSIKDVEMEFKEKTKELIIVPLRSLAKATNHIRMLHCVNIYERQYNTFLGKYFSINQILLPESRVTVVCQHICCQKSVAVILCPMTEYDFDNYKVPVSNFHITDSVNPLCYYEIRPKPDDSSKYIIKSETCPKLTPEQMAQNEDFLRSGSLSHPLKAQPLRDLKTSSDLDELFSQSSCKPCPIL